ncbi:MAG TPA: N-6 DNA methylase [Thermoanaerobaculia bacterium]|nr:N-6 DNA methylase [Thermoanaerobaculia bacterium]
MQSAVAAQFRPLLESCGYRRPLLLADFPLGVDDHALEVPLAAFAHEPADAGSACIAVIAAQDEPSTVVPRYRSLGAPVVFTTYREACQWWVQGAEAPRYLETIALRDLQRFFEVQRARLAPESVYRAKTRGRFESGYQLDFVDVGLMPLVEAEMGRKLGELVERAIVAARDQLGTKLTGELSPWLMQSVFWLLAAKTLADKAVPGFENLDLADVDGVLGRVGGHYGEAAHGPKLKSSSQRRALEVAAEVFRRFAPLAHATPEALASVYETSLVSKEMRAELGIHSTPAFLARYVVWRLAAWIEEIPVEQRHVFEPTCGQGSFLIAAMRVLRDLLPQSMSRQARKAYLRGHLHGLDIDPFAVELARLSLTIADIPNPDGWDLQSGNVFVEPRVAVEARRAAVLLANPPFESFQAAQREELARRGVEVATGSKAAEVLRRTLHCLRPGAVFGLIVPRRLLHASSAQDIRALLIEHFELAEITQLPDKLFSFSDAESAVLLGRRLPKQHTQQVAVRYSRVEEQGLELFRNYYSAGTTRLLDKHRFSIDPGKSLLVPELEEVWEYCKALPTIETVALVGKGLEFKSDLPSGAIVCAEEPFDGATPGFSRLTREVRIDQLPQLVWLNLDPKVIRRPGAGADVGLPQIIVNHARVTRGPWRLKAMLDNEGHPVTSSFLTVRPLGPRTPLLLLWALLNGPFAQAYCSSFSTERHNLKRTLDLLPVPRFSQVDADRIAQASKGYLERLSAEGTFRLDLPPQPSRSRELLLELDAEVLRLYDLPARLERQLLDYFAGWPRPGVPFVFDRYFPADFEPWIPLHLYLSEDFQRSTSGRLINRTGPVAEVVKSALGAAVRAFED